MALVWALHQAHELLAEAGVDAIGLITEVWQPIVCNPTRVQARELVQLAPPSIAKVLIVTEENVDEVCAITRYVAPDVLQLHGLNSPDEVATIRERTGNKVVKTLHVQGGHLKEPAGSGERYLAAGVSGILLDSSRGDKVSRRAR